MENDNNNAACSCSCRPKSAQPVETAPLSSAEFEKYITTTSPLTILDVRTPEEYAAGHIAGAINISFVEPDFVEKVEKTVPKGNLALYCKSGKKSAMAHAALLGKGYNIRELAGGITSWEADNMPTTTDK